MKKIMLIGFGAMAQEVLARLPEGVVPGWILAREHHHPAIRARFGEQVMPIVSPVQCHALPDLVLECASQQAVADYAESILRRGWRLAVISTGALADERLYQRLQDACREGGQLMPLSGAVAGLDGLSVAREGGLTSVMYQSCKSPDSWRGSLAETLLDLDAITTRQVFFHGSARQAAQQFPANANVAATIALAGIGMDHTSVELVVDPATQRNTHTLHAVGAFGELTLELCGYPLARNPKTSLLAVLSAVHACRQLTDD
ncbi:aspartate dehydrogenase [Erwinia sp. AnSW2-5]|uniref:aspartate dehydrogenase n=1 Tax=Erwinia sp. AnSW2-5 TaxID=3367692 RepID=UPI00385C578A